MIRLILYALFFYFCYRLIRGPLASLLKGKTQSTEMEESEPDEPEMVKDPQCGTYFMKRRGVPARVGGKTLHFCSEACRDKFLESR
ncbi:MAG: YHS domain-containing protein [Deltaproteobacteria bacterium]|nr:YHS domain-containing protein [Deltaproteobacteria bacterium]